MRLSSHEHLLRRSLKLHLRRQALQCPLVSIFASSSQPSRRFSASPTSQQNGREVAILGGGITGLASAYYLSRADPKARITIYEVSDRVGGWIQSKRIPVDGGSVLFESGPRTLRTSGNGLVTARLIQDLQPKTDLIAVPKLAPASTLRYIYYPDRLNRLPARGEGLVSFISNVFAGRALYSGVISGLYNDWIKPSQNISTADESVGHYLSRRFNSSMADNLASAVFHGIYAGDIYQLSVRSLLPMLLYLEGRFGSASMGSVILMGAKTKIMEKRLWEVTGDQEMKNIDRGMLDTLSASSVFTLQSGLGTIATRLEEVLHSERRAHIRTSTPILRLGTGIENKEQAGRSAPSFGKIMLYSGPQEKGKQFDTIISTLSHNKLTSLLPSSDSSSGKASTVPSVTVMVVNLWFKNPNLLASNPGFGYLIPRSIPFNQNPECALGVIFDSFAAPNQDIQSDGKPGTVGTKLTIMMGGHWWNGWEAFPSSKEGITMARTVLARHLGIVDEPDQAFATLQKDCIPQYTVGHTQRMRDFHYKLLREFGGNLRVAGGSYGGVGVNDCIRTAWDLGKEVKENGWKGGTTGLERYVTNGGMAEFVEVRLDPQGSGPQPEQRSS